MHSPRIKTIDAGRGLAMMFVFLSHFIEYYLNRHGKLDQLNHIWLVTRIASPSFMLISGITLGYLFYAKKSSFKLTKRKFIDRGLFLLTIAHLLIMISWIPIVNFFHGSMKSTFITDAIGLCLIFGALSISRIKPYYRILLAICLYAITWYVVALRNPKNTFLEIIAEMFCGELRKTYFYDNFPFLPWFILYLIGTVIGEKVGYLQLNGLQKRITVFLFKIGFIAISSSILILLGLKINLFYGFKEFNDTLLEFLSYAEKDPPGLVYFLFYGGSGLVMLAFLNILIEHKFFTPLINILEIVGKTSLFAFIFQYYIYFSVVVWFDPPYWKLWPLFFLGTVIFIVIVIKFWYIKGFNKYLTILDLPVWKLFDSKKGKNIKLQND